MEEEEITNDKEVLSLIYTAATWVGGVLLTITMLIIWLMI